MISFAKILSKYRLSEKEHKTLKKKIDEVLGMIKQGIKQNKINAEVMLGGSAAKGTFIKGDFDCDIFVRFEHSYKNADISFLLAKILSKLKLVKVHGSRDYFQLKRKGIEYEIIPVLKVTKPEQALNVTDMSPLHVEWVKKHITPKLRDEIILTKLFCKAQGIYGAESYIKGFSGHVVDILTIYYKTFANLLKNAAKWESGEIIDPEKHGTASELNESKLSPLIIIDPLQPERNAAAALSNEKFVLFREKARAFLKKPSLDYFKKHKFDINQLKKGKKPFIVFNAVSLKGKEDVVGTKLLKSYEFILNDFIGNDFTILSKGWEWDKKSKAVFWYVFDKAELPEHKVRIGPPSNAKQAVASFKQKHKKAFLKGDRFYAYIGREFRKPKQLALWLIRHEYIKDKVKSIRIKNA